MARCPAWLEVASYAGARARAGLSIHAGTGHSFGWRRFHHLKPRFVYGRNCADPENQPPTASHDLRLDAGASFGGVPGGPSALM